MSWMSWMPCRAMPKWEYKASESLRTSKKTFEMVPDSRILFNVFPSFPAVVNAEAWRPQPPGRSDVTLESRPTGVACLPDEASSTPLELDRSTATATGA
jgi:hypothetical protein